jgi:hypothetical protein
MKRQPIRKASELGQAAAKAADTAPAPAGADNAAEPILEPTSRLTIDLPASLHAAMKVSCKKRKVAMAHEVMQLLEWHYRGGSALEQPEPVLDDLRQAAPDRAVLGTSLEPKMDNGKLKERMVRTAFTVPASLHQVISVGSSARGTKIADEVRQLFSGHYLGPGSIE